jgi:exodeoxyribonuclease V alpha subunit
MALDETGSISSPETSTCHGIGGRSYKRGDATLVTRPQPESSTQEVLAGLVERVTFHNAENGFCVLRTKARGHRELVTVVGHAAVISAGEWITASGEWINDRAHGQQFKARFMRTSAPTSIDGIEKYLSSGMIRGIGPVYAKKMIKAFGEKVFDIIEAEPDRLREVDGIGPIRAKRITDAWAEQTTSAASASRQPTRSPRNSASRRRR